MSGQKILHDRISNRNYLLIHKNGSTSLESLATTNPQRYTVYDSDFFNNFTTELEVIAFIREPIDRFVSGLFTQMSLYQIPKQVIVNMINNNETISFLDLHTTPQFWKILSLGKKYHIKFKLLPMSEMYKVDKNIKHLNKGPTVNIIHLTKQIIQRLDHFYTEDVVMYTNFLNCTVSVDEIINRIKLEKNFVDDLMQYKQSLTYLF